MYKDTHREQDCTKQNEKKTETSVFYQYIYRFYSAISGTGRFRARVPSSRTIINPYHLPLYIHIHTHTVTYIQTGA